MRPSQRSIAMDFSNSKTAIDKNRANAPQKDTVVSSFTAKTPSAMSAAKTSDAAERKGHKLELDHERAMSMTGVKDVPVFTDKNITVRLENETLLVTGQNLAVKTLDIENGKLQVTGRVFSLRYTNQAAPTSFLKRIFK